MSYRPRKLSLREHRAGIARAAEARDKYGRLLSLAVDLDFDVEVDRLGQSVREFETEVDHLVSQALAAGFTHDQLEGDAR